MANLVIQNPQGRDVTTSIIVAQVFGKEHRNVLRDIENLSCSDNFRVLNFEQATFENQKTGQMHKMYEMTKDGFSFLVMGYTGDKAGQFKEMFINEFNKREMMLRSDDYILARSQEILNNRLQLAEHQLQLAQSTIDAQQEELKTLAPLADYTKEVLQSTSTYTFTQMAKELNFTSVNAFVNRLRERKIIFKQSGQWLLTARYAGQGYTTTRTARYFHKDGRPDTSVSTVWTERGRAFLHYNLNK